MKLIIFSENAYVDKALDSVLQCGEANKQIMEMFNVGRYYITDIKRGRIKTPKFTLIY
jgi:hypothetical protein